MFLEAQIFSEGADGHRGARSGPSPRGGGRAWLIKRLFYTPGEGVPYLL